MSATEYPCDYNAVRGSTNPTHTWKVDDLMNALCDRTPTQEIDWKDFLITLNAAFCTLGKLSIGLEKAPSVRYLGSLKGRVHSAHTIYLQSITAITVA